MKRLVIGYVSAAILAASCAAQALAQDYPSKTVRIVVPAAAGGATDIVARLAAVGLSESMGQQFVVENRAGGGGVIGSDVVAKSAPDGYTLLMGAINHAINAALVAGLPYDSVKDFVPIAQLVSMPNVLVVHPSVPARNVAELIDYAKRNPGKLIFASSGNGTSQHLSGELFKVMAKIDILHVPYKGSAPAVNDLLGGHVSLMFDNLPSAIPHIKAGKTRALAVTSAKRASALADVPSIAQSGLPGFDVSSWLGMMGPGAMQKPVVDRLAAELAKVFARPAIAERLVVLGAEARVSDPAAFRTFLQSEMNRWAVVVRQSKARID